MEKSYWLLIVSIVLMVLFIEEVDLSDCSGFKAFIFGAGAFTCYIVGQHLWKKEEKK